MFGLSNVFTMNGRSFPGTQPLLAKKGERVRIRIGNLSTMSHHAIHLHGYYFKVIATDGGEIPEAGQWLETTVHTPNGSTRTLASPAGDDELRRDGIAVAAKTAQLESRGQKVEFCGAGESLARATGPVTARVKVAAM